MTRTLEFYYDYGSPYSYLADTQVEAIAKRTGAALVRKPMLLGGVFKATGNASPMTVELKSKWSAFDMPMWARHYGVPFQRNPFFPVNTLQIMRGAVAAEIGGFLPAYVEAMFHHMWEAPKKLDEPEVIRAALDESGFDGASLLQRIQDPEVKQALLQNTEQSVARGTFGSPTFYVGEEIWFGKDRLRDVEDYLSRESGRGRDA